MEQMIQVEHISKEFVSPKKYPGLKGAVKGLFSRETVVKKAVEDISFSIPRGEIVGYIGSNGAGKSTTIKMMTGILTPTSGTCMVDGVNPSKNRRENAANIGVVFGQRTQLWWDLPLGESFSILKEIYDVPQKEYERQMDFLNGVLGLPEFIDRPVRTLSLGQRMRADLGAALLHNPKVLYLDEPTIGLDLVVKDNIREAIKEINQTYETTVVLTTHDIGDIEELCSRIIIIDEGRKIYDGSLAQLKDSYGTKRLVTMEVHKPVQPQELALAKRLGVSEEACKVTFDEKENTLSVLFDKHKVMVPQLMNAVMGVVQVQDMQIQETELAQIVKEIYRHGAGQAADTGE